MVNDPHRHQDLLETVVKGQKVGGGPILGNARPFPKIVGIILLLPMNLPNPLKTNHPVF